MRVLQVTNIVSHHQLPLARKIVNRVGGDNFRFAVTQQPDCERQTLGWNSRENEPWIILAGEIVKDRIEFERWWDDADVVICGDRRLKRMQDRCKQGRLTFYMSERWWKPPIGMARLLHPVFSLMTLRFLKIAKSKYFHYLPMGHFAATDMKKIARFTGRMWKWGYFTEIPTTPLPSCDRTNGGLHILWAGRMLGWKRVDIMIRAFRCLRHELQGATLTVVGDGQERTQLVHLAKQLLPVGSYQFLPPIAANQVFELMQQHQVYVLPSNGYEGWGAVVNEAMSVGCAVIASDAVGSAKTMIVHGENGLLFKSGNWKSLAQQLSLLGHNEKLRRQLAEQGKHTIKQYWSPEIAAERLLAVSEALLGKHSIPAFVNGPMARIGD